MSAGEYYTNNCMICLLENYPVSKLYPSSFKLACHMSPDLIALPHSLQKAVELWFWF